MTKSQCVLAAALAVTLPAFGFAQHDDTIRLAENAPFNATHGRVTSIEVVRGSHSPAGAVIGGVIERDYYRIAIRFKDGREEAYQRDSVGDLHVGDPVRLDDRGGIYRD